MYLFKKTWLRWLVLADVLVCSSCTYQCLGSLSVSTDRSGCVISYYSFPVHQGLTPSALWTLGLSRCLWAILGTVEVG